jgi:adenylate cyclase
MKTVLKWALLALAAVGCWAAIQQARQVADLPAVPQTVVTTRPGVTPDVIRVTYFSSDVRCATCVRIERLTRECVERNFAPEIQSGRIQLRTVNLDGPGNEHFIQDYRLISKTVIISDLAMGQEVRWENLQDVWTKQRDERAFEAYVVDAVRRHLGTST